jgi:hypothetical protein
MGQIPDLGGEGAPFRLLDGEREQGWRLVALSPVYCTLVESIAQML